MPETVANVIVGTAVLSYHAVAGSAVGVAGWVDIGYT